MGRFIYFTDEQKQRANDADLVELLRSRGEALIRSGREYRLGRDHSVTVRGNQWFDHAANEGGYAIRFVQRFYGLSYPEAVTLLLHGTDGISLPSAQKEAQVANPFTLPPAHTDRRRVYAYLMQRRHIDRDIISHFVRASLLYEDAAHHNCVFVGTDESGVPRHAHLRSTNSTSKAFRINVGGSLPQYSFHHAGDNDRLYVFEAPIDLLSFLTLYQGAWQESSYVALCGTSGQAMHWMVKQNMRIRHVFLCLDNDKAGIAAAVRLKTELERVGYQVDIRPSELKDWNEDLCAVMEASAQSMETG